MLTRAKISYDLYKSPYRLEVDYGEDQKVIYHFSSELYKTKFTERMNKNRIEIDASLSNRFNVHLCSDILADLRLYSSIEKRGYLISFNEEFIECQNNIILGGLKLIRPTYNEQ